MVEDKGNELNDFLISSNIQIIINGKIKKIIINKSLRNEC